MKAILDANLCNGCGICEVVCPEVFRMEGKGSNQVASAHTPDVPEEAENFCRDAADCCRPAAITIVDQSPSRPAQPPAVF